MKKIILTLIICSVFTGFASAQVLPSFQFGIKGGINYSTFPQTGIFNNSNQAGYVGGLWARFGALGFNFQPEVYLTSKNVDINSGTAMANRAKFTSIDVPMLFGGKIGAFGFGGRFYTGPLVSFAVNKDQSAGTALNNAATLNYKDQNFAWQFGAGVDIQKISLDLRYEAGITKQYYGTGSGDHTRVSLFNLSLGYRLF